MARFVTICGRLPVRRFAGWKAFSSKENSGNSAAPTIWALQDVSFDVRQGEVLGLIGRNGAGKSTLLKILSRITEPTEGRIASMDASVRCSKSAPAFIRN